MDTHVKNFFKAYSLSCTTEADLYCHTGKELDEVLPRSLIEKLDKLDNEIKAHVNAKATTHEKH